jgi:hypothetical protein
MPCARARSSWCHTHASLLVLWCYYLYFGTSKASKVSAVKVSDEVLASFCACPQTIFQTASTAVRHIGSLPPTLHLSLDIYIYTHTLHTHTHTASASASATASCTATDADRDRGRDGDGDIDGDGDGDGDIDIDYTHSAYVRVASSMLHSTFSTRTSTPCSTRQHTSAHPSIRQHACQTYADTHTDV